MLILYYSILTIFKVCSYIGLFSILNILLTVKNYADYTDFHSESF